MLDRTCCHVLMGVLFLCAGLGLSEKSWAQEEEIQIPLYSSVSGRTVFRLDEPIALRLASGEAERLHISLASAHGQTRKLSLPTTEGWAFITLQPLALTPGEWMLNVDEPYTGNHGEYYFTVVDINRNTTFDIVGHHGTPHSHGEWSMRNDLQNDRRLQRFIDIGFNKLLVSGDLFAPPIYSTYEADMLTATGARTALINSLTGGHQIWGNNWVDPQTLVHSRYKMSISSQIRRRLPTEFGTHLADEPGLQWQDGGPLGVHQQVDIYEQMTGLEAPNRFKPFENIEAWLAYNRWRGGYLPWFFKEVAKEIHLVDEEFLSFGQYAFWMLPQDGIDASSSEGYQVMSTHFYPGDMGILQPIMQVDAMRQSAWDRPMWMLPLWHGSDRPECVRGTLYGVLSRKVEGITHGFDWVLAWPEAQEVHSRINPISGMLRHTQKLRDPVAIFHSQDAHLYDWAEDVSDGMNGHGRQRYGWTFMSAWWLAAASHYTPTVISERDVLNPETIAQHKVVYAPLFKYVSPEVKQALEQYIEKGGVVLLDQNATVDIKGATQLDFALESLKSVPEGTVAMKRYEQIVEPHIQAFRTAVAPHAQPHAQCDRPEILLSTQGADAGRYLWAVNVATDRNIKGDNLLPIQATLTLPEHDGVVYDVFARSLLEERTIDLDLKAGDARIYAFMPERIESIKVNEFATDQQQIQVRASVHGQSNTIDAVIPLKVEILRPDHSVFGTYARATQNGEYTDSFAIGRAAAEGTWRLRITELLSENSDVQSIKIQGSSDDLATAGDVDVFDRKKLSTFIGKQETPVMILHGKDDPSKEAAKDIAQIFKDLGRDVTIDDASNHLAEREMPATNRGHAHRYMYGLKPLKLQRDVVLVGDTTNALIRRLAVDLDVTPYPFSQHPLNQAYPGPTRGLIYWARGAFDINHEIMVIYATDPLGLAKAIDQLHALTADN